MVGTNWLYPPHWLHRAPGLHRPRLTPWRKRSRAITEGRHPAVSRPGALSQPSPGDGRGGQVQTKLVDTTFGAVPSCEPIEDRRAWLVGYEIKDTMPNEGSWPKPKDWISGTALRLARVMDTDIFNGLRNINDSWKASLPRVGSMQLTKGTFGRLALIAIDS